MARCIEFDASIERMLADEIAVTERERLLAHAETCAECREFVELHHRLMGAEIDAELPTEGQFAAMRSVVLDEIRASRPRESPGARFFDSFRLLWARPALGGALVVLVVLVGLGGFATGRVAAPPMPAGSADSPTVIGFLVEEARTNRGLADVEESPYLYSNVSFREVSADTLDLSFDVTRHLTVRRARQDPLVTEVLVQSLLHSSPLATRLQALDFAGALPDDKIKQALLVTLLDDSSQAVRLRALERLRAYREDPEVQVALLSVLRDESSVQIRLTALDWLVDSEPSRERALDVLDELSDPEDRALQVRAARYQPVEIPQ